ncbi:MAG: hypothetical protein JW976_02945 [Syntrophaceae bacterium]|nr:hypothetical protein [Syntrophaceae bacterium]
MKKRKVVICFLLYFIMLFGFVFSFGCSSDGGGSDSDSTDNTDTDTPAPLSSEKAITAFGFETPAATGVITEATHTIDITVPYGTNVNALIAIFTTTGVNVNVGFTVQISGLTVNDFTNPVTYTVTAADATTQDYMVTVTTEQDSTPANDYTGSYYGTSRVSIFSGGIRIIVNGYSENSIDATFEDLRFGYGLWSISYGYVSGDTFHGESSKDGLTIVIDGTFSANELTLSGNFRFSNGISGTFTATKE